MNDLAELAEWFEHPLLSGWLRMERLYLGALVIVPDHVKSPGFYDQELRRIRLWCLQSPGRN